MTTVDDTLVAWKNYQTMITHYVKSLESVALTQVTTAFSFEMILTDGSKQPVKVTIEPMSAGLGIVNAPTETVQ